MDPRRLADLGATLLGAPLRHVQPLAGGDLSSVVRIELADGRIAVVKRGSAPATEADMLRAMAAAGVPVPEVLAVNDDVLVLSWVDGGGAASSAWTDLGRVAAVLHAAEGPRYGWHESYAFGAVVVDNGWHDDWPRFWAERRLLPFVRHIPSTLARRVEALAGDLGNRLPAHPRASLLHGDLWTGNVMARDGRVAALIDPCCYYGHAEVDIAMLQLFASPAATFFDAYGTLSVGADERLAIYRLWPALVHLELFGDGYRRLIESQLDAAGG